MQALILNVTNWIGYHIVDRLLNEGYQVQGIKNNNDHDHLIDFFARNSDFELVDQSIRGEFPVVIGVGELPDLKEAKIEKLFVINSEISSLPNATTIHAPYLFGEWMPMTEEGFAHKDKRISFSSEEFREDGLYIGDFLDHLVSWIEKDPPSNEIFLQSSRKQELKGKKLDKSFLVEENSPKEAKIKQVISHYKRFQDLYP